MKRLCISVLILVLCGVLLGCTITTIERWTANFTVEEHTDQRTAEDGTVLAKSSYQVPRMTAVDQKGKAVKDGDVGAVTAAKFNAYFDTWLTERQAWFDESAALAADDYALFGAESAVAQTSYEERVETSYWCNSHIVCVRMDSYSYTGGAHGLSTSSAVTFDLNTGETVSPVDLMGDFTGLQTVVAEEILRQIDQRGADGLFDNYAEIVNEWDSRTICFTGEGITVVFGVYDIAPYMAGEQSFTIPYDVVEPYLSDSSKALLELT